MNWKLRHDAAEAADSRNAVEDGGLLPAAVTNGGEFSVRSQCEEKR